MGIKDDIVKNMERLVGDVINEVVEGKNLSKSLDLSDNKNYNGFINSFNIILESLNSKKYKTHSVPKDVLNKLYKNLIVYISENQSDLFAIVNAYEHYIWAKYKGLYLENEEKEADELNEIYNITKNDELLNCIFRANISLRACIAIQKMREYAEDFFNNKYSNREYITQEKVNEVTGNILGVLISFIEKINDFFKTTDEIRKDEYQTRKLRLDVIDNIELIYKSLLYFLEQFYINAALSDYDLEFNGEAIYDAIRASEFDNMIESMTHIEEPLNNEEDIMKQLLLIFHMVENNSIGKPRIFMIYLACEAENRFVDKLTNYLWQQLPEGDINRVVIAFYSFIHLYSNTNVSGRTIKYFGKGDIDFSRIYNFIEDGILIEFLEHIRYGEMEKAVAIDKYKYCEIPYYILLLSTLYKLKTKEDILGISMETRLNIVKWSDNITTLKPILTGKEKCNYLPMLIVAKVELSEEFTCEKKSDFSELINIEVFFELSKLQTELYKKNLELNAALKDRDEAIDSKNEMIERHSHNWKHISFPATVKEVAEKLAGDENYKSYANKLFKAYNSENILKQEIFMLKLKHSGSSLEVQKQIMSDVLLSNSRTGINIHKIIEDSLDLVLFRILMENVDTTIDTEKVRENLSKFKKMEELRESYSKHFILKKIPNVSLIDWFNQNIYNIIINFDENWNDVKVKKEGTAYAQLVEICIDLFHNAINYGKKDEEGSINIELNSEEIDDIKYLTLKITNPVDYQNVIDKGTNQGLASLKKLLEKLNYISDRYEKAIPTVVFGLESENNKYFSTKIYFKQQLLLKKA